MKRVILTLTLMVAAFTGCQEKKEVLEPAPEPSYYRNLPYFTEKYTMFDLLPIKAGDIVMLGDDYFDRGLWNEWFPLNNFRNRGITYDASEHVLYRVDKVAQAKPGKIFVSVGRNDILKGFDLDSVATRISEIFTRAETISPKTKLYYLNTVSCEQESNERVDSLNAKVLELSRSGLFEYIDIDKVMREGVQNGTYSYNGGAHLNANGYAVLCQAIERQIGVAHRNKAWDWAYEEEFFAYYKARATLFNGCPADHHKIIMLGDSLNNNAWWNEFFPGVDIINRGISGDTAMGILQRLDEVVAHSPEKVFLLTGPNDLINDPQLSNEAFWERYQVLIKAIREKLPDTKLYIHSILPLNPISKFYENYNDRASEANANLAAGAQQYGYTFIDLVPSLKDENGDLRAEYTSDGLHLTGAGYQAWVGVLQDYHDNLK